MKKSHEEYQNLIELLKKALEFYGNEENYLFYENKDAPISLDEGSQARFALEKIKDFDKSTDAIEKEFMEQINDAVKNNVSDANILGLIEQYKQINDE